MSVTQRELDEAKRVGRQNGTVDTNGRHWEDRNKINNAVNEGKAGK